MFCLPTQRGWGKFCYLDIIGCNLLERGSVPLPDDGLAALDVTFEFDAVAGCDLSTEHLQVVLQHDTRDSCNNTTKRTITFWKQGPCVRVKAAQAWLYLVGGYSYVKNDNHDDNNCGNNDGRMIQTGCKKPNLRSNILQEARCCVCQTKYKIFSQRKTHLNSSWWTH